MAQVKITRTAQALRRRAGRARHRPRHSRRRVHRAGRPVRLRQEHAAADHRRARGGRATATIEIGGEVVNDMRPRDRDVAMVFQDYALYPHMTRRAKNIGFGLKARKMPKPEIEARVRGPPRCSASPSCSTAIRASSPAASASASPSAAPSCATRSIFLFDEPLSNLDAQLRDEMRGEIKRLHQEIATTMIYVTHDQIEAMTLADRIVLMRDGRDRAAGRAARPVRAAGDALRRRLPRLAADELPARHAGPQRRRRPHPARRRRRCRCRCRAAARSNGAADGMAVLLGLRPEHMTRARRRGAGGGHRALSTRPSSWCSRPDRAATRLSASAATPVDGRTAGARRQPAGREDRRSTSI